MVHGIIKNGPLCWQQSCGDHTGLEVTSFLHADNLAVVQVVQNPNAVDPLLCSLLRSLYFYSAHNQFTFTVAHSWCKNVAAMLFCATIYLCFTHFSFMPHNTLFLMVKPSYSYCRSLIGTQAPEWLGSKTPCCQPLLCNSDFVWVGLFPFCVLL